MGKSDPVWVIVSCEPATKEFDAEYSVVNVNGGRPGGTMERDTLFGPVLVETSSDAEWARDFFDTCTSSETLLSDIFGDDVPEEIDKASKFIVRGRIVIEKVGIWGEADWDSHFEVESWRVLSVDEST